MTIFKEMGGKSDDNSLDFRQLYLHIDDISDKLRTEYISAQTMAGLNDVSNFLVSYPNEYSPDPIIMKTDGFGRYYTDLPAKPLNIPFNKGVWQIVNSADVNESVVIRRGGSGSFTSVMDINRMEGRKWCEIEGARAYYKTFDDIENFKPLFKMIPFSSYIPDNQDYPVPNDMFSDIIAYVKATVKDILPEDNSNNSNDNSK